MPDLTAEMLEPDVTSRVRERNWMQGWHCGKLLIYLTANISANKLSLPQGQGYTEENTITATTLKPEFYTQKEERKEE